MAVTQYIGARYVPLFANPIDWSNDREYEPLTIVYYQGNSYTSRQSVPTGIDILNEEYWALTGNYNAQVQQYRQEVLTFDGRITANANDIDALETALPLSDFKQTTVSNALTELQGDIATNTADIATNTADISTLKMKTPYYTPEMFGAIGDGVTDDTNAFETMLNAVSANSVIILSKTYLISDTLTIDTPYLTIKSFGKNEYKPELLFANNVLTGITITASGGIFQDVIFHCLQDPRRITLIDINLASNNYNIDWKFEGCYFSNAYDGVHIAGRNVAFTNCMFSVVTHYSIQILDPQYDTEYRGIIVDGCRFHSVGGASRLIYADIDGTKVKTFSIQFINNFIDGSGLWYYGISDNVVIENNFSPNTIATTNTIFHLTRTILSNSVFSFTSNTIVGTIRQLGSIQAPVTNIVNVINNVFSTTFNNPGFMFTSENSSTATGSIIINFINNVFKTLSGGDGQGKLLKFASGGKRQGGIITNNIVNSPATEPFNVNIGNASWTFDHNQVIN